MEEALKAIAAAADVPIAFSADVVPAGKPVTVEVKDRELGEVMRLVLRGHAVDLWVSRGGQLVVAPVAAALPTAPASAVGAQRVVAATITGRVIEATAQRPVAGASVVVAGTGRGAQSDANGNFTISGVPAGPQRVRVSALGYAEQEQSVTLVDGQSATVSFSLQPGAVQIEGVVAVGYGSQRRRDVTGSVATVNTGRLEETPNTSVAQALQGATAGVAVTAISAGAEPRFNIQIRGQNSITASNEPLIVVDGIPYTGNLAELNQNDIASLSILKDASSTAIYGARGANGVVLVTTKQGRAGQPSISYQGYVGMQEIANLPRLMNGAEFAEFKCQRVSHVRTCDETLTRTERANLDAGRSTDWLDLATRSGTQQQHALSFSGGSSDTRFYLSGSALNTQGVALNDQFKRYTGRVNLTQKFGRWLDLGVNAQLSQADRSGEPANFSEAYLANPLINAYEADERTVALTPWPEDPERSNPLQNLNIIDEDVSRRTMTGGYLELRPAFLDGFSYRLNAGLDLLTRDNGRYLGRNTRQGLSSQGQAVTVAQRNVDWTLENLVRYVREFGDHSLDLTALFSAQAEHFEEDRLASQGFPNDVLTYRQANVARSIDPSYAVLESGLLSQMGRVNYGYAGRYLVTLTARRDGFSGFGENYKYGLFPSLALAWNVSEEPFWAVPGVSDLKVRLSYGQNGNHAIQPYQTLARLAERSYLDAGATWPGFQPATLGNPNLRWETSTSLNGGVDFGILDNRLTGTLDLYSSYTDDLLLNRLISPIHGIPRMVENIGRVRNRGVELSLSGAVVDASTFSWNAEFNVSANRNRIVDLYGDETDDLANRWFIGHSINTNYGWVFDGVWQTTDDIKNSPQPTAKPGDARVRDINGDGTIDVGDRTFLGTSDPSYTAGLTNTLKFGGLTVSAFVHTVQGVTRYNDLLLDAPLNLDDGAIRTNALKFEYWSPTNPIHTRWENRQGTNVFQTNLHEDASFIRLKDITVSYDLPSALADRVSAGTLRVFATGRNLWTHTDWTGLDPELSNQRATPLERLLSVGVNAAF